MYKLIENRIKKRASSFFNPLFIEIINKIEKIKSSKGILFPLINIPKVTKIMIKGKRYFLYLFNWLIFKKEKT